MNAPSLRDHVGVPDGFKVGFGKMEFLHRGCLEDALHLVNPQLLHLVVRITLLVFKAPKALLRIVKSTGVDDEICTTFAAQFVAVASQD